MKLFIPRTKPSRKRMSKWQIWSKILRKKCNYIWKKSNCNNKKFKFLLKVFKHNKQN